MGARPILGNQALGPPKTDLETADYPRGEVQPSSPYLEEFISLSISTDMMSLDTLPIEVSPLFPLGLFANGSIDLS